MKWAEYKRINDTLRSAWDNRNAMYERTIAAEESLRAAQNEISEARAAFKAATTAANEAYEAVRSARCKELEDD